MESHVVKRTLYMFIILSVALMPGARKNKKIKAQTHSTVCLMEIALEKCIEIIAHVSLDEFT